MLARVKGGRKIVAPQTVVAAHQAVFGEQQPGAAAPAPPAQQAAVMPEIAHGLAHHVCQEHKRDVAKDSNTPSIIATDRLVDVKGGAAVLGFFRTVPKPHGFQPWIGTGQRLRVAENPVGKNSCEVLRGSGGGNMYA